VKSGDVFLDIKTTKNVEPPSMLEASSFLMIALKNLEFEKNWSLKRSRDREKKELISHFVIEGGEERRRKEMEDGRESSDPHGK